MTRLQGLDSAINTWLDEAALPFFDLFIPNGSEVLTQRHRTYHPDPEEMAYRAFSAPFCAIAQHHTTYDPTHAPWCASAHQRLHILRLAPPLQSGFTALFAHAPDCHHTRKLTYRLQWARTPEGRLILQASVADAHNRHTLHVAGGAERLHYAASIGSILQPLRQFAH